MSIALSPSIFMTTARRFPSQTEKQGISQRFTEFFHSVDSSLGQRALGPDQTISGKVHSSVSGGIVHARTFDEQKGLSKTVGDVRTLLPLFTPCGTDIRGAVLCACVENDIRCQGPGLLHDFHEARPRHPRGGVEACRVAQVECGGVGGRGAGAVG